MRLRVWLPIIALVLLHFVLRANNINGHYAYMDEGFHAQWAKVIWQFDRHPANFADGKLLLYYWIGLFQGEGLAFLFGARMGIAILSCITAVGVYKIAQSLFNAQVGLLALALYAIFPLAQFYERFAFADPIASMFTVLVVWRSIAFPQKPTLGKSIMLGVLLAGATLSKLTVGLIPLMPFFASILLTELIDEHYFGQFVTTWLRRYARYFVVMASIVVLAWLPIVVPVYLSTFTDTPMRLVPDENVESEVRNSAEFVVQIFYEVGYFMGVAFLGGLLLMSLYWATRKKSRYTMAFLLLWLFLLTILPMLTASIPATRYYMPLSAPLVLLMSACAVWLWRTNNLIRLAVLAIAGLWLLFSVPFSLTIAISPNNAPLQAFTYREFSGGALLAEKTAQEAAQLVNQNLQPNEALVGDWGICYTMYFHLAIEPTCLEKYTPVNSLWRITLDMKDEQTLVMFAFSSRGEFFTGLNTITWQSLGEVSQYPLNRAVGVWRFTRKE
jgi:4-amino-4-deoxy-L-arabinose transferase-like glycosyltransferase